MGAPRVPPEGAGKLRVREGVAAVLTVGAGAGALEKGKLPNPNEGVEVGTDVVLEAAEVGAGKENAGVVWVVGADGAELGVEKGKVVDEVAAVGRLVVDVPTVGLEKGKDDAEVVGRVNAGVVLVEGAAKVKPVAGCPGVVRLPVAAPEVGAEKGKVEELAVRLGADGVVAAEVENKEGAGVAEGVAAPKGKGAGLFAGVAAPKGRGAGVVVAAVLVGGGQLNCGVPVPARLGAAVDDVEGLENPPNPPLAGGAKFILKVPDKTQHSCFLGEKDR